MSNQADLTMSHLSAILGYIKNKGEAMEIEHDLMLVEHKGTLAEFQAEMEELHRRARGEGEWNDDAWEALDEPTLNY